MKSFALIFLTFFATQSFAEIVDENFVALKARHKIMVNNDDESWIYVRSVKHQDFADLGEVVAKVLDSSSSYLEGMKMDLVSDENKTDLVIGQLMGGYYPYFCATLIQGEDAWEEDPKACTEKLKTLFGDALEKADTVAVLNLWGNYYGMWSTINVILQNHDTKESLIIDFDIVHEI